MICLAQIGIMLLDMYGTLRIGVINANFLWG
jgi:hypothetical protein